MEKENVEVVEEEVVEETAETEAKVFTEEEVNAMLQSETDKRVSQALKTAKEKWEQELESKKSEVEKLAKMSEEERYQAKLEQERQQFEQERQQFMRERMELETVKQLSSEGLPTGFANYLVADNAETVAENISLFKSAWQEAVEAAVNERLKGGSVPKQEATTTLTQEDFNKMSLDERVKLYSENYELYKEFTK